MVYTNNVPQPNQQIATTQPIIEANFNFLQTGIGVEHNFNASGSGSDMYHLKASMPNISLSPALPSGTNGVYFVNNNAPVFYNGTNNFNLIQNLFAYGSNAVGASAAFQIIAAGNWMGLVSAFQNISPFRYQFIQFWVNSGTLIQNSMASGGTSNISLQLDGSNNLQILNSSGSSQTIKWQVIYNTAP